MGYAWERVRSGMVMPGVIVTLTDRPIGQVIGDLEILLLASQPEELEAQNSLPAALIIRAEAVRFSTGEWCDLAQGQSRGWQWARASGG